MIRKLREPLDTWLTEALCAKFEAQWQESPLAAVREFAAKNIAPTGSSFPEVLLKLIAVDLEKRWALRSDKINAQLHRGTAASECSTPFPPDFKSYLFLFSDLQLPADGMGLLAQAELNARWVYGDIPDPQEYASEFREIQKPAGRIPAVTLSQLGRVVCQTELFGNLVIGRQAQAEPAPPAVLTGHGRKLICCEIRETTTSRTQLELQVCSRDVLRIANISHNRTLLFNGRAELRPGEMRLESINPRIEIPFKTVMLTIERK